MGNKVRGKRGGGGVQRVPKGVLMIGLEWPEGIPGGTGEGVTKGTTERS